MFEVGMNSDFPENDLNMCKIKFQEKKKEKKMKSSIVDTKQRLNESRRLCCTKRESLPDLKINIQNPGSDDDDKYATSQHVSNIWNTFLLINLSCGKDLKLEIEVVKQVNDQYNLCKWMRDRISNLWRDIIDKDVPASQNLLDPRVVIV